MTLNSLNDSDVQVSPRQSSASISFSTNDGTLPMDYSSDQIDVENDIDDVNSLQNLPISPVSHEEDDRLEQNVVSSKSQEEGIGSLLVETEEVVPNELSISTSQTSHCNEQNASGQSPLSISSSNCFLDGIKLLIERGANVNLQDSFGRTPLHLVCENANAEFHHESVDYLLRNGANPCIQDVRGRAPLHIAAHEGCVICINKLMEHRADPNARDSSGDIPLHIAASLMHLECMEALSPSSDNSASSVESTSSILQFESDSFYQFAGDRSMARSSLAASATTTGKESWHDSGYFTARGNAWTKSKYYASDDKIEEEIDFSQSTIQSETIQSENDSLDDPGCELPNTRLGAAQPLDFILRLVLSLIDFLLSWIRNHIVNKVSPMIKRNEVQPERRNSFSFKEPPAHIKEAMDCFKRQQNMQN